MKRTVAGWNAVALWSVIGVSTFALAQHDVPPSRQTYESAEPAPANLQEVQSETAHVWNAGKTSIRYTATAGNLIIRTDDGKPYGSMFYDAYTETGAPANSRPVSFLYNGGPSSASIWLHMGSVGPVRVVTDSPNATGPAPYSLVPNQYSLIDKSDLVFIDAPLTGYSRAVGQGTVKDFAGVDQDVKAFEKFIVRYLDINHRWQSPKYLFGESYGTPRSAALVAALENDGVEFNGVILLSSMLNHYVRAPGFDIETKAFLPSYAAIAWYYNKVPHTLSMEDFVEQAREFSRGPYSAALDQGDGLSPAEADAIAAKVAAFTGLSVQTVKELKLRISPSQFRKSLLRADGQIIGRYDARFRAFDADDAAEVPGFDPSSTGIEGAFVAAFHDYMENDLKYTSTEPYYVTAPGLHDEWDWSHHPSGAPELAIEQYGLPDTVFDLADAMRKNPHLRVFAGNGWFDLAAPFFETEHDLAQMMLPPSLAANVQFGYYLAGHMIYLDRNALKQLHADLEHFYSE